MQNGELNPVEELKEKLWYALSDFNKKTGILIETIDIVHMDISNLSTEKKTWVRDRIEIHFKTGVYR